MTYANAQSPISIGTELGMDIAQTVVTGVAATEFHFGFAGHHIEFIMDHQNFLGLYFEKTGQG